MVHQRRNHMPAVQRRVTPNGKIRYRAMVRVKGQKAKTANASVVERLITICKGVYIGHTAGMIAIDATLARKPHASPDVWKTSHGSAARPEILTS